MDGQRLQFNLRKEITSKIPNFWVNVLQNRQGLIPFAETDVDCLSHLQDISSTAIGEDPREYEIQFVCHVLI